jgi:PAS domain S-box-containing protein
MLQAIIDFLSSPGLPHGYCLTWSPKLLWTMVGSHAVIALSYYSIPIALLRFVRNQPGLNVNWAFVMFAVFILACGTTHLIAILNIWIPAYRLDAAAMAITAGASAATAIMIWPLMPIASARLHAEAAANEELKKSNARLADALSLVEQRNREIEESEHRFRLAIEGAPIGLAIVDLEGRFLVVNRSLFSMLGYSEEELLKKTFHDITHSDDPEADLELLKGLLLDRVSSYPKLLGLRKDGSQFPIEVALSSFASGADDRVIAMVKDVSEARRAEQMIRDALKEKELLLGEIEDKSRAMERLHAFQRAVFEQAPDGILVADHKGHIVEANERIANLFGYTREGLTGMSIDELVPQSVRAEHHRHRAAFEQAPSTRVMSRDRTLQGQRADGSEFPIEVALAPMKTAEGHRVIAIVKDVSEARAAEQLTRDALKEKELLLGEIHHRVKNNLQIVHSLLDMQAGLTSDARAASALRDSQNRIQSMALIHQTLYQSHDFAKVEFGVFLETLMVHLQGSYGRRDLSLSSHSESVRLAIDRAIPCGLIVNELVTNALKHAFPDGRAGAIRVEVRLLHGVDVEVAVNDDGVGIPDTLNLESLSSLGMQLVLVLSEQLHAQLHIQRRNPTRIAITFPLN